MSDDQHPTIEEISQLSLRAVVAYAVKAADRIHPRFASHSGEDKAAVHGAISLAREFAAGARQPDEEQFDSAARNAAFANNNIAAAPGDAYRAALSVPQVAAMTAICAGAARAGDAERASERAHATAEEASYWVSDSAKKCRATLEKLKSMTNEPSPALGAQIDFRQL